MPDNDGKPNFWSTLPGILTGVAAVITAAGALFLGLRQTGSPPASRPDSAVSQPIASPPPQGAAINTTPGEHDAATAGSTQPTAGIPAKAVRITKSDGTMLWSYESKFSWGDQNLTFDSGQSIPFQSIRAIDVLGVDDEGKIKVQVKLADGKVVTGSCAQFSYDLYGSNDLGDIRVSRKDLKQVVFPH